MRGLRSAKQRKHLWYAANGMCQLCGNELGEDWQADHKTPWSILPETNVHDMQALCKKCNQEKGDKIMSWRYHQEEMIIVCNEILSEQKNVSEILVSVTPGGGKSVLPVILASRLIPSIADKICWVVPRDNLRDQGETVFVDPFFMTLEAHEKSIRKTGNEIDPSRGSDGYITTYQSIGRDPELHYQEFSRYRYMLFLDEPHHVDRGGGWHKSLQPLVDNACLVVYASGTFERGDNLPIAFIPYVAQGNGEIVSLTETRNRSVINYNRRTALREGAIVPLHFEVLDGKAEWVDIKGVTQTVDSLNETGMDTRAALLTALTTEYAYHLLDGCVAQWQEHKRTVYNKAKLLVVAPNISVAKQYQDYLEVMLGVRNVGLATSDDSKLAKLAIHAFKTFSSHNALVTVGMAYEGLDIPDIVFVACLTYYRSKPWLEQCFARANRTSDGKGYGVIWGPDDPEFKAVVDKIKSEQLEVARVPVGTGGGGGGDKSIISIGSESTIRRATNLGTGEDMDYARAAAVLRAAQNVGINGLSTVQLNSFLVEFGLVELPDMDKLPTLATSKPILTPSQREKNLKGSISKAVRRYCIQNNIEHWVPNKTIKDVFGKSRDTMTVNELSAVWRFVQDNFGNGN